MKTARHTASAGLLLVALLSMLCGPAFCQPAGAGPAQSTARELGCPSQEFDRFLGAFSEDVRVQQQFTQFPLEYRYIDATLIGTEQEDAAAKRQMIESFAAIPFRFGSLQAPRLFPGKLERKRKNLETRLQLEDSEASEKNLVLFQPNTGYSVNYRFRKNQNCWRLFLIDSRSL